MHALHCAELAADARTPQLKATLLELSANWTKLAASIEAAQALLAQDAENPLIGVADRPILPAFML
jgi:hypothetical protein